MQLVTAGSKYKNVFDTVDFHQWKRLRAIGSPSFSARRMKEVSHQEIRISVSQRQKGKYNNLIRDLTVLDTALGYVRCLLHVARGFL